MNLILQKIFNNFYTTPRLSVGMTDGGGPFGFDIHFAMEVDYLVNMYKCDAIFETGTNIGDTTEYLSKMYPEKTIITSEIEKNIFAAAKIRLSNTNNIVLNNESSEIVLQKYKNNFDLPFYYLDAHGCEIGGCPLKEELEAIAAKKYDNVCIAIHDFKVPGKDFGYDTYDFELCYEEIEPYLKNIYPAGFDYHYNSQADGAYRGIAYFYPIKTK